MNMSLLALIGGLMFLGIIILTTKALTNEDISVAK